MVNGQWDGMGWAVWIGNYGGGGNQKSERIISKGRNANNITKKESTDRSISI